LYLKFLVIRIQLFLRVLNYIDKIIFFESFYKWIIFNITGSHLPREILQSNFTEQVFPKSLLVRHSIRLAHRMFQLSILIS